MNKYENVKYPNAMKLFNFCQKILEKQNSDKMSDHDIGSILDLSPSDCSLWKKGERDIPSIFLLKKLAQGLGSDVTILHDIMLGTVSDKEGVYEYDLISKINKIISDLKNISSDKIADIDKRVIKFIDKIFNDLNIKTSPIYIPEILQYFDFITFSNVDMSDKLSRVLKIKSDQYHIQFTKGDMKPQTRVSGISDLAKIIFENKRNKYIDHIGEPDKSVSEYEQFVFMVETLIPRKFIFNKINDISFNKNAIINLADMFWVPKSLMNYQISNLLKSTK